MKLGKIVRRLVDHLVSGMIEGTVERARTSAAESVDDVRRAPERIAGFSGASSRTSAALKSVLRKVVYQSDMVVEERSEWTRKIAQLFAFFIAIVSQKGPLHIQPIAQIAKPVAASHHGERGRGNFQAGAD